MRSLHRLCGAALTVCSAVAFGALGMSGVFAAVIFPTMRGLGPSLPEYAAYSGAHWSLAAGTIAEGVFEVGFGIAGVSLALSVAAAIGITLTRAPGSRPPAARAALLLITLGLFLTHVAWLQPRMNSAAREYRLAAAAGENERAASAKSRFDGMHPNASRLIAGATLSAFGLLAASAWAAGTSRVGSKAAGAVP